MMACLPSVKRSNYGKMPHCKVVRSGTFSLATLILQRLPPSAAARLRRSATALGGSFSSGHSRVKPADPAATWEDVT